MNLEDDIKYEICKLFHSLCDYLLRYRIEAITNFSAEIVSEIQSDQKKRYNELKESTLPNAIIAKKTKEFRCQARDQMMQLVRFKASNLDLDENIKETMESFHKKLNKVAQIKERTIEEIIVDDSENKSLVNKIVKVLFFPDNNIKTQEEFESITEELSVEENKETFTSKYFN
jgi:hypothetical protein